MAEDGDLVNQAVHGPGGALGVIHADGSGAVEEFIVIAVPIVGAADAAIGVAGIELGVRRRDDQRHHRPDAVRDVQFDVRIVRRRGIFVPGVSEFVLLAGLAGEVEAGLGAVVATGDNAGPVVLVGVEIDPGHEGHGIGVEV